MKVISSHNEKYSEVHFKLVCAVDVAQLQYSHTLSTPTLVSEQLSSIVSKVQYRPFLHNQYWSVAFVCKQRSINIFTKEIDRRRSTNSKWFTSIGYTCIPEVF